VAFLEIGFIILALIFFQPVLGQVDELVRRLIVRDRTDYRQVLEDYSRQIISVFDFNRLLRITSDILVGQLGVEKIAILTQTENRKFWELHSDSESYSLSFDPDPLLAALSARNSPLYIDDIKEESALARRLRLQEVQFLVPFFDRDKLAGVLALGKKQSGFGFSYEDISFLRVLSSQLVIALSNSYLYQQSLEKQRLEEELSLARQIQSELLPKTLPSHPKFQVSAFIQPSQQVGGDYYDFVWNREDRLSLAIADSVGKGMPAALLVSLLHSGLRAEIRNSLSPSATLTALNQLLSSSTRSGRFASLFYAELHLDSLNLCYCNAGHNYPILVRADGSHSFMITGGLILGAFPDAAYQESTVAMWPDDVLVLYSDGLSEAQNQAEEEFGESRILETIRRNRNLPAEQIQDDLTLVVLKTL
jgi:sigma-B regulation protein RsbU (phosphoserine phosphatase)